MEHKPFAKLFDTPHGQFLVTIETNPEEAGPRLRFRADAGGIEAAMTLGPWPDDEAGWSHVQKMLEEISQDEADSRAAGLTAMIGNLLGGKEATDAEA